MTFWCAAAATAPPRAVRPAPTAPTDAGSPASASHARAAQGVPTEASQGQIKKAYYQRARECHPDKHAGDDAKAEEFKRLSDAYQTLFDNERRAAYDLHGKAGEQGGTWVDPRDLYAATFGGPEFEPWVGVLGAQPPDELVQAAERAAAAARGERAVAGGECAAAAVVGGGGARRGGAVARRRPRRALLHAASASASGLSRRQRRFQQRHERGMQVRAIQLEAGR